MKRIKPCKRIIAIGLSALLCLSTIACSNDAYPNGTETHGAAASGQHIQETLAELNCNPSGLPEANGKFYADYETYVDTLAASKEIAVQIGEEGMVLLKNENQALPLSNAETKLSLFGVYSTNIKTGGGGSGSGLPGVYGIEPTTLRMSLENAGFRINEKLYTAYSLDTTLEPDPDKVLNDSVVASYGAYNDAAIIVLARAGAEGSDLPAHDVEGHSDPTDHYLELQDNEKALIRHVKQYFDKVIVLLNSAHILEVGELNETKTADNLGVDAIIQIGLVGNDAAAAIGGILKGDINPSGHTVDLWAYDFTKAPSWTNWGTGTQVGEDNYLYLRNEAGELVALSEENYHSVEYREDIYMGYRYYETVAAELDAQETGSGESWYKENVVYPFGYGLSYTSFDWELDPTVAPESTIDAANQTVTMKVKVTNTGTYAGKDVVQIYVTTPYTKGGVEKASRVLMGFAKTSELEPGESETVTVSFVAQDMASFDWNDKNNNGFVGYELEAGEYTISACSDSHTEILSVKRTIAEGIQCATDYTTGNQITALFSQTEGKWADYNSTNEALLNNLLTREADMTVLPAASTKEDRTISQELYDELQDWRNDYAYEDDPDDMWYVADVPKTWTQAESHAEDYSDVTIRLPDMSGIDYTNPILDEDGNVILATDEGTQKWEEFLNQLTWEELVTIVSHAQYGRYPIESIGKPEQADMDGPSQLGWMVKGMSFFNRHNCEAIGTAWPCAVLISSTWNTELGEAHGRAVGNESIFVNSVGWYGPAMNLHRNPLSGRNFEYYSEDGVLSGLIAASVVKGATSKGTVCFLKHYFLNDQETNRDSARGLFTYATEQAIRELYLKPFEYAVKSGGSMGIMNAANRVGNWVCYANAALHDGLLRDEWNYKGLTLTDGWAAADYAHVNSLVRNGVDVPLGPGETDIEASRWDAQDNMVYMPAEDGDAEMTLASPTQWYHVRRAALHELYVTANSNGIDNGLLTDGTVDLKFEPAKDVDIPVLDESNFGTAILSDVVITEGDLPVGMRMSENGILTGAARENGIYSMNIELIADGWVKAKFTVNMSVGELFHFENGKLKAAGYEVGNTYDKDGTNYTINKAVFQAAEGTNLPAGLTLSEDGTITGAAGTYHIVVSLYIEGTETNAAYESSAGSDSGVLFTQTMDITI